MADFNTTGIEGLRLSLEDIADLPEDILLEMLEAEGEVLKEAQERKIAALGLVDSHQLAESITVDKKLRSNGTGLGTTRYILVYPKGVRTDADGTTQTARRRFKKRRKGKTESVRDVTNAEVGFINEFGAPGRGIKPEQWMRLANEEAADAAASAAMAVYNGWLDSKGL